MATGGFPSLYSASARFWLADLSRALGRPATLDDVPDDALDRIADLGFDWLWLLGVWQTGPIGAELSVSPPERLEAFRGLLADFTEADVCGSPYAIQGYVVHKDFGGNAALARFRERLRKRGIRLLLDFIPNHTARDHPWTLEHPDFYVGGLETDLANAPQSHARVGTGADGRVLALGRDPYFPAWFDTFQLNYRHAGLRNAMRTELQNVAELCDGVRCDMAMLVLPEVFTRTWGERATPTDGSAAVDEPFWPGAIADARARNPGFLFLAEAYWDLEWALQQQGFDFTYDKRLYDRLRGQEVGAIRDHLRAAADFQRHLARFLENHDEPRASVVFPSAVERAAATVSYLIPGMRFFHDGQLEGRKVHASIHLRRRPDEPIDGELVDFYNRLLTILKREEVRIGQWRLLECRSAWADNPTFEHFLAWLWEAEDRRLLVAINYGPTQGQCYVTLPPEAFAGRTYALCDLLGDKTYLRDGNELKTHGLFVDLPAWGSHVCDVTVAPTDLS